MSYGLKELAQNQIDNATYYLGGRIYDNETHYGQTEEIYEWERGTSVYSQNGVERSFFWIGKIALMYSSDYSYTFSKGVEEECLVDSYMCFYQEPNGPTEVGIYNHPETSWIYNSNVLEKNLQNVNIKLLTRNIYWGVMWLDISLNGRTITYGYYDDDIYLRPTLYLKSNVEIVDGDGSLNNPYHLSYDPSNDKYYREYNKGNMIIYDNI